MKKTPPRRAPLFEVRHSRIHGYGRVRAAPNPQRHDTSSNIGRPREPSRGRRALRDKQRGRQPHVPVHGRREDGDRRRLGGNEARFINHACDPNCQSATEGKAHLHRTLRTIQPGEELSYDYSDPA